MTAERCTALFFVLLLFFYMMKEVSPNTAASGLVLALRISTQAFVRSTTLKNKENMDTCPAYILLTGQFSEACTGHCLKK